MLRALTIIGLFLAIIAPSSHACDKAITLQVGPFFSTTFIHKYWQGFATDLSEQTGCAVHIRSSSSYERYLDTLLAREGELFIVPNLYVQALSHKGLKPALVSSRSQQIYILSRKNIKTIKTIGSSELIGDTILVASRFTQAFLELKKWLEQQGLTGKVDFDFNHSHDSAAMLMLKGEFSSAVVLSSIYTSMPSYIQAKYQAQLLEGKGGGAILVKSQASEELITAINNSKATLPFQTWSRPAIPYLSGEFAHIFQKQLNAYISGKQDNINKHKPSDTLKSTN